MIRWSKWALVGALVSAAEGRAETAVFGSVPAYVGQVAPPVRTLASDPAYMTAVEMQSKVASLTGFSHPGFLQYADVLGRVDPKTGQRTNAQPTLMGVLVLQQIAASVATYVVEREEFLDDGERIVFPHIHLSESPSPAALDAVITDVHTRWLGQAPTATTLRLLTARFRQAEQGAGDAEAGFKALISLLLQHGALYFY